MVGVEECKLLMARVHVVVRDLPHAKQQPQRKLLPCDKRLVAWPAREHDVVEVLHGKVRPVLLQHTLLQTALAVCNGERRNGGDCLCKDCGGDNAVEGNGDFGARALDAQVTVAHRAHCYRSEGIKGSAQRSEEAKE